MSNVLMTLYAVRNRDGQYFRAKGYGGCGETWVDSLSRARIYPKPGPARAQVTFFANNYPKFGVPELVELRVTEVVAIQEQGRVRKSQEHKARQEAEYAKRDAEREKRQAETKLNEAQETLRRLREAEKKAEETRKSRHT
jgi:hypothetical protein